MGSSSAYGTFGVALAQAGFGKEQSAGAIVGGKMVRAAEIFDRFIDAAASLGQLAGAEVAAGGEVAMAEALARVRRVRRGAPGFSGSRSAMLS